jgi:hypothetical protein
MADLPETLRVPEQALPALPEPQVTQQPSPSAPKSSKVGFIVGGVLVLGLLITGVVLLLQPGAPTAQIRDIFIIFLALQSFVIGAVLVILVVQISLLTNLLQNEIKPILKTTNDTVNTIKGTTVFISNNLAEPVIKLNEFMAGFKKFMDILRPNKR